MKNKTKPMRIFTLSEDNIHLNQLLKIMNWCSNGAEANNAIADGQVMVNGVVELRKRNKITRGMIVKFIDNEVKIAGENERL